MGSAIISNEMIFSFFDAGMSKTAIKKQYKISQERLRKLHDEWKVNQMDEKSLDEPTHLPTPPTDQPTNLKLPAITTCKSRYIAELNEFCIRNRYNRHLSGKDRKLLKLWLEEPFL